MYESLCQLLNIHLVLNKKPPLVADHDNEAQAQLPSWLVCTRVRPQERWIVFATPPPPPPHPPPNWQRSQRFCCPLFASGLPGCRLKPKNPPRPEYALPTRRCGHVGGLVFCTYLAAIYSTNIHSNSLYTRRDI
jgi:hypothetical protein